jgi:hypothetical protein
MKSPSHHPEKRGQTHKPKQESRERVAKPEKLSELDIVIKRYEEARDAYSKSRITRQAFLRAIIPLVSAETITQAEIEKSEKEKVRKTSEIFRSALAQTGTEEFDAFVGTGIIDPETEAEILASEEAVEKLEESDSRKEPAREEIKSFKQKTISELRANKREKVNEVINALNAKYAEDESARSNFDIALSTFGDTKNPYRTWLSEHREKVGAQSAKLEKISSALRKIRDNRLITEATDAMLASHLGRNEPASRGERTKVLEAYFERMNGNLDFILNKECSPAIDSIERILRYGIDNGFLGSELGSEVEKILIKLKELREGKGRILQGSDKHILKEAIVKSLQEMQSHLQGAPEEERYAEFPLRIDLFPVGLYSQDAKSNEKFKGKIQAYKNAFHALEMYFDNGVYQKIVDGLDEEGNEDAKGFMSKAKSAIELHKILKEIFGYQYRTTTVLDRGQEKMEIRDFSLDPENPEYRHYEGSVWEAYKRAEETIFPSGMNINKVRKFNEVKANPDRQRETLTTLEEKFYGSYMMVFDSKKQRYIITFSKGKVVGKDGEETEYLVASNIYRYVDDWPQNKPLPEFYTVDTLVKGDIIPINRIQKILENAGLNKEAYEEMLKNAPPVSYSFKSPDIQGPN